MTIPLHTTNYWFSIQFWRRVYSLAEHTPHWELQYLEKKVDAVVGGDRRRWWMQQRFDLKKM